MSNPNPVESQGTCTSFMSTSDRNGNVNAAPTQNDASRRACTAEIGLVEQIVTVQDNPQHAAPDDAALPAAKDDGDVEKQVEKPQEQAIAVEVKDSYTHPKSSPENNAVGSSPVGPVVVREVVQNNQVSATGQDADHDKEQVEPPQLSVIAIKEEPNPDPPYCLENPGKNGDISLCADASTRNGGVQCDRAVVTKGQEQKTVDEAGELEPATVEVVHESPASPPDAKSNIASAVQEAPVPEHGEALIESVALKVEAASSTTNEASVSNRNIAGNQVDEACVAKAAEVAAAAAAAVAALDLPLPVITTAASQAPAVEVPLPAPIATAPTAIARPAAQPVVSSTSPRPAFLAQGITCPKERDIIFSKGRSSFETKTNVLLQDLVRLHACIWLLKRRHGVSADKIKAQQVSLTDAEIRSASQRIVSFLQQGKTFVLAGIKDVPKPFLTSKGRFLIATATAGANITTFEEISSVDAQARVAQQLVDLIQSPAFVNGMGTSGEKDGDNVTWRVQSPYEEFQEILLQPFDPEEQANMLQHDIAAQMLPMSRDAVFLDCGADSSIYNSANSNWGASISDPDVKTPATPGGEKVYEQQNGNKAIFYFGCQLVMSYCTSSEQRLVAALTIWKEMVETVDVGSARAVAAAVTTNMIASTGAPMVASASDAGTTVTAADGAPLGRFSENAVGEKAADDDAAMIISPEAEQDMTKQMTSSTPANGQPSSAFVTSSPSKPPRSVSAVVPSHLYKTTRFLLLKTTTYGQILWVVLDPVEVAEFLVGFVFEIVLEKEMALTPAQAEAAAAAAQTADAVAAAAAAVSSEANPMIKPSTVPLLGEPTDDDVLFGRGGMTNCHPGNRRFRDIIALHRPDYIRVLKMDKPAVSRKIVRSIRNGNPPGRFLKKASDGKWYDVGDRIAAEKTSQALRERSNAEKRQRSALREALKIRKQDMNESFDGSAQDDDDGDGGGTSGIGDDDGSRSTKRRKSELSSTKAADAKPDVAVQRLTTTIPAPMPVAVQDTSAKANGAGKFGKQGTAATPKRNEDYQELNTEGLPPNAVDEQGNILVTDYDILCGRGGLTNHHKGNKRFRDVVALHRPDYVRATKVQKPSVARVIVRAIRNGDPPGRFLRKDEKTGKWIDIGDKKAAEKTSQALREKSNEERDRVKRDSGALSSVTVLLPTAVSYSRGGHLSTSSPGAALVHDPVVPAVTQPKTEAPEVVREVRELGTTNLTMATGGSRAEPVAPVTVKPIENAGALHKDGNGINVAAATFVTATQRLDGSSDSTTAAIAPSKGGEVIQQAPKPDPSVAETAKAGDTERTEPGLATVPQNYSTANEPIVEERTESV